MKNVATANSLRKWVLIPLGILFWVVAIYILIVRVLDDFSVAFLGLSILGALGLALMLLSPNAFGKYASSKGQRVTRAMWRCDNCGHLNGTESDVCEYCRLSKVEAQRRRIQRESEEEMEQIESDMWDEDQGLESVSEIYRMRAQVKELSYLNFMDP
jgi:hypothetical protein